jgi:hypothetical protein
MLTGRHLPACVVFAMMASALPGVQTAEAQEPFRTGVSNSNLWLVYSGDHPLRAGYRTSLLLELQARRADLGAEWQQLLVRGGVSHVLGSGIRAAGGYAFVRSWPYGDAPARAVFPEHRSWQQIQLAHAAGPINLAHRYRLEQRWIGVTGTNSADPEEVTNWRYVNRFRYLARATVPLSGVSPALQGVYASAFDEVFLSFGREVQFNVFDQNRLGAVLGLQLSPTWRAEAGYLYQYLLKATGRDTEHNHTLQVVLISSAPLGF